MTTIAVEMLKTGMVEAVICVQRYGLHPMMEFEGFSTYFFLLKKTNSEV